MTITRRGFLTVAVGGTLAAASAAAPALACPDVVLSGRNLLSAADFVAEGYAWCKLYQGFEGDGGLEVSEVGGRSQTTYRGYQELVAWMYEGRTTLSVESVARFDTSNRAHAFFTSRTAAVEAGPRVTDGAWRIRSTHRPRLSGADEAIWWHVRNRIADPTNTIYALVRRRERIAILRMDASASDPAQTMDTPGLLRRAVRSMAR